MAASPKTATPAIPRAWIFNSHREIRVRHRLLMGATVVALALTASACSSTHKGGDKKPGAPGGKKADNVYLLNVLAADPFWAACTDGANKAATALGNRKVTELDANQKLDAQTNQMQTVVQKHPDFVMISPVDSKALIPAVKKARDQGLSVVAFNTPLPNTKVDATVEMDEVATGAAAAKEMIKLAQAKGLTTVTVLHLVGAIATEVVQQRRQGFDDEMKKPIAGLKINVIDKVTNWLPEKAVSAVEDTLTRTHVDAIFAESDYLTPFVEPVLKRNGYTPLGGNKHLIVGGLGGIPGGMKAIRDGWQDFTLTYPIDRMCDATYRFGQNLLNKKSVVDTYAAVMKASALSGYAPRLTNNAGMGPYVLATADLVNRNNVNSPQFWANQAAHGGK